MTTHPISAEEFHNFMDTERGAEGPLNGFYWMVHSHERNAMLQYHFINWLINVLLIIEAALSTVFVALGASENQYQKVVAILGAVNGVITGVLAIIKGQGLPGRFYQHASGLREVIREIGRLERIVASNGIVTREDCDNLYSMYDRVQREYDTHSPDIREIDTPPLSQIASSQHGEERLLLNSGDGSETERLGDRDGTRRVGRGE